MPERTEHLNLFLLTAGVADFDSALKDPEASGRRYDLKPELGLDGAVFVRSSPPTEPKWARFIRQGVAAELEEIRNRSSSALILLRVDGRIFALSFGFGRNLLLPNAIERNFGLKVALNSIDPQKIRSLDLRTFDSITRQRRTQTSQSSSLEVFGVDIDQELLRSVTAEPVDIQFAKRLTGSDCLTVAKNIEFAALATLCGDALARSQQRTYQEHFAWIDHLQDVRSKEKIDQLDLLLVHALRAERYEKLHMAPPENIDWQRTPGFSYTTERGKNARHVDLKPVEFVASLRDNANLAISDLKKIRVREYFDDPTNLIDEYPVYETLVFETVEGGNTYVLSFGRWFKIDREFIDSVNRYVAQLDQAPELDLPHANRGEIERDYNMRVNGAHASFALMDAHNIRYGGGQSQIEFCDLFTLDRCMIHVKRGNRSSSLSHLFSQGAISGQLLIVDPDFRRRVREALPETHRRLIPDEVNDPSQYRIVYALILEGDRPIEDELPFFSRLNLMNFTKRLLSQRFRVAIKKIEERAADVARR